MNQSSNSSNTTSSPDQAGYVSNWITAFFTLGGFQIVVGSLLNLWFLAAIFTCPTLRQRMRNKLICNLGVALALESTVTKPFQLICLIFYTINSFINCHVLSVIGSLYLIHDFVSCWIVVTILAFYLAEILAYDPTRRLTALSIRLATAGVLLLPWIGSLITMPSIMFHYHSKLEGIEKWVCVYPTSLAMVTFKSVDTALPVIICIILIVLAVVFKRRRSFPGDVISRELIGQDRHVDSPGAYVALVAAIITCEFFTVLYAFESFSDDFRTSVALNFLSYYLGDSRVFILPLPWLLLPDLRQRLKTWRPWKRPLPDIHLTVVYEKEES